MPFVWSVRKLKKKGKKLKRILMILDFGEEVRTGKLISLKEKRKMEREREARVSRENLLTVVKKMGVD